MIYVPGEIWHFQTINFFSFILLHRSERWKYFFSPFRLAKKHSHSGVCRNLKNFFLFSPPRFGEINSLPLLRPPEWRNCEHDTETGRSFEARKMLQFVYSISIYFGSKQVNFLSRSSDGTEWKIKSGDETLRVFAIKAFLMFRARILSRFFFFVITLWVSKSNVWRSNNSSSQNKKKNNDFIERR